MDVSNDGKQNLLIRPSLTNGTLQLLFLGLTISTTFMALKGGERHAIYLSIAQLRSVVRLNWISQGFGIMTFGTSKVSIALLVLRFTGPGNVWQKRSLYFCMISSMLVNSLGAIITFVQCNPPRALWEEVPNSRCWNPKVQSGFAIFTSCKSHQ